MMDLFNPSWGFCEGVDFSQYKPGDMYWCEMGNMFLFVLLGCVMVSVMMVTITLLLKKIKKENPNKNDNQKA